VTDALGQAISDALADPLVGALVVSSQGKCFSGGADLFDLDTRDDTLDRLRSLTSNIIEDAPKPIVIAIQGFALGGGFELALAGHYRVCTPDAEFALPEVKLGLLPGAGGTQRLPRLVGKKLALEMMLSGNRVPASVALEAGLVDVVAQDDLRAAAVAFAAKCVGCKPRRTKELPIRCDLATGEVEISRLSTQAEHFIVRCIEAAVCQTFSEGMALEKQLFEELRVSEVSRGLRHVFFGQRQVSRIPGVKSPKAVSPINSVAVVGAGTMGTGITAALINSGLKVNLIEPREQVLDRAIEKIGDLLRREVAKGRISATTAEERLDLVSPSPSMATISDADLIIEAVFEDAAIKQKVFKELDKSAKSSALLATNTSTLNVDAIASVTNRAERVVGLHFFSPANVMKLVEVVRGAKTSGETLSAALNFTKRIGKVGVVAGVCDGFIGNRMFEEYLRQAYFLLEEGALPQQVDVALEEFGMAMGPFKVMDLAGQDVGWSIRKRRAVEQPDRPYSGIPDLVCEMGRYGQKTGAGFYLYPDGRTPQVDPFIDALVMGYSKGAGSRRDIGNQEIVERCIFALVNEGAKILTEGVAYRAVDVDMVYIFGYGFPRARGGPMFYAERLGLHDVLQKIVGFQSGANGWAWSPAAPLLVELAQSGGGFSGWSNG
jgi:3-hydroxyacyl-CoA dehydrogenase